MRTNQSLTQNSFQLHLKEIKYRISYLILSFICCFSISFLFKSELLIYFTTNPKIYQSLLFFNKILQKYHSDETVFKPLEYFTRFASEAHFGNMLEELLPLKHFFIFTHITEAFISYIKFCLFISLIFIIPYFFYLLLLFLKPGLYYYEYKRLSYLIFNNFLIIYPLFFFIYSWFFWPTIIKWAQSFANETIWNHSASSPLYGGEGSKELFVTLYSTQTTLKAQNLEESWLNFQPKLNEFISFYINFTLIFIFFMLLIFILRFYGPTMFLNSFVSQPKIRNDHFMRSTLRIMRYADFTRFTKFRLRSIFWFILLIISAIITPPDILMAMMIFCPLLIIFELIVWYFYYIINLTKHYSNPLCAH